MEGESKSSFLDRLKDATSVVATRAREGVEELQTKHELTQAYTDLGRTTAGLVESGAVSHPELNELVEKIRALKAQLEAKPEAKPEEPAEPTGE
jgi:multidrug resistance efflux pump